MKVIVACNCYKRPEFTRLCLPIAIDHAGLEAEWRLVDDGSGDGTADCLRGLAKRHKHVEAICNAENVGHYVLRNRGFEHGLEQDADVVVNIDNDILFPQNWLRDLLAGFPESGMDIGSAWIVNDPTLTGMIRGKLGSEKLRNIGLDRWVDTEGCGGAAIAHSRAVLESGIRYRENHALFVYGDSKFNGFAMEKGFKVGVYLGVQCWHLQEVIHIADDYERAKHKNRHWSRHKSDDGFEEAYALRIRGRMTEGEVTA